MARLTAGIGDLRWPQPPRQASSRRSLNQSSPRRKSAAPAPTPRCWCPLRGCKGAAAAAATAAAAVAVAAAGPAVIRGPPAHPSTCHCLLACRLPLLQKIRDECTTTHGPDAPLCQPLIEAHKQCLRAEGFNVGAAPPPRAGGRAGGCCLTLCSLQATLSGSLLTVLAGPPTCWPACRSRPLQQQSREQAPAREALT